MRKRIAIFIGVILMVSLAALVHAESPASVVPPSLDVVTLKDGSVIYGEVIELSNGELKVKTAFGVGDIITIKWDNVPSLTVNHPLPFHFKEGTVIVGTAEEGPAGIVLKAAPMSGLLTIPIDSVSTINPLIQPPVVYSGGLTAGLSQASGNCIFGMPVSWVT